MEEGGGVAPRPCPWPGREELWARLQVLASGPRTERPIAPAMSDAEYEDIARRCGIDTADFCREIDTYRLEMCVKLQAIAAGLQELCAKIDRACEALREQSERNRLRAERLVAYVQRRRERAQARRSAGRSGKEDGAGVREAR
jgi:hypothetical protein